MFQPPNTPLSIVESLNDYIDWSDEDIDFDLNDDNDHEPKQKTISRVLSAVADIATKVFLRPWPNRHIDSKDPNQFVSREESEYRLLLVYISWTLLLSLAATGLLIACPFYCINQEIPKLHQTILTVSRTSYSSVLTILS